MKLYKEAELLSAYQSTIFPFFEKQLKRGVWRMRDGIDIVYYCAENPHAKGVIVISSGRSECAKKYAEVIHDFYQAGYSVFIHDHRGQGESSRMSDNPHHGYVDAFSDYIDDFETLIDAVIKPWLLEIKQEDLSRTLLCHSMGGAIGALLLLTQKVFFSKAIFSSPMFGIAPPVPVWFARIMLNLNLFVSCLKGKKASYFIGESNYQAFPFDKNRLMQSEVRYQIFKELYANFPLVQLGGVTAWWIVEALKALETIQDKAEAISLPCLLLQSGSDLVVSNDAIEQVHEKLIDSKFKTIEGAMHELLFEKDSIRTQAFDEIEAFINK